MSKNKRIGLMDLLLRLPGGVTRGSPEAIMATILEQLMYDADYVIELCPFEEDKKGFRVVKGGRW